MLELTTPPPPYREVGAGVGGGGVTQAQQAQEQGQVLHPGRQTGYAVERAEIVISVEIESLSVLVRQYVIIIIMKLLRNILDIISLSSAAPASAQPLDGPEYSLIPDLIPVCPLANKGY